MEQTRDIQMKYIDQEKKLANEKENCLRDEMGITESNMTDPSEQTKAGNDDNSCKKVEEQIPDVVISNQIVEMDINHPIESSNKCLLTDRTETIPTSHTGTYHNVQYVEHIEQYRQTFRLACVFIKPRSN